MFSFLYAVFLALFVAIYVIVLFLMKRFKNQTITNLVFVLIIDICYLTVVIVALIKNGPNDWNFQNTLPTANISPFMFTVAPLFFVFPKTVKKYFALLISLLAVGMILSPSISCIHWLIVGYKFHVSFLFDYIAHFAMSLWGVYLIQSKQIDLKIKDSLISGSIIFAVAFTMIIINLIFDTSFFGLSLRGKHNIYNQVLVDNSYLSALIYFTALALLLVCGYLFQKLLMFLINKRTKDIQYSKE